MSLTTAVIGCGSISRFHFPALQAIGANVKWICDVSKVAAAPWVEHTKAQYTADVDDIIRDPEVRVVHVLAPSPAHAPLCRKLIPTGKAVICEKTLATNADDALQIVRLAMEHKTLFYTAYMKRYLPATRMARQLLPRLGKLISVHARIHQYWGDQWGAVPTEGFCAKGPDGVSGVRRNNGGGILVCGGSHLLDLIMFLTGRPDRVYGEVCTLPGRDYDVRATALLRTGDVPIHFEAIASPHSRVGFQDNGWDERIELIGDHGIVELFSPQWERTDVLPSLVKHCDNASGRLTEHRFAPEAAFTREIASYHEQIAKGEQGEQSILTGYEVDEVISAIMGSSHTGKSVEITWRA